MNRNSLEELLNCIYKKELTQKVLEGILSKEIDKPIGKYMNWLLNRKNNDGSLGGV